MIPKQELGCKKGLNWEANLPTLQELMLAVEVTLRSEKEKHSPRIHPWEYKE